jgi:single-stranded DNA-binding protein
MAYVRIEQRNGRLAADAELQFIKGRDGQLAKASMVVISNVVRSGDSEATSIRWTVWGRQAENAAKYLRKGSRVNVVGTLRNNHYGKDGERVYGFDFNAEEIDYLDGRRGAGDPTSQPPAAATPKSPGQGRAGAEAGPATRAYGDADLPF